MNKENKKAREEIKKLTKSWDFRFYYLLDSIYLKMRLFLKKIKQLIKNYMDNAPTKKITIFEAEMNMKSLLRQIEELHDEMRQIHKKLQEATKQSEKEELMIKFNNYQFIERQLNKALTEMEKFRREEWENKK